MKKNEKRKQKNEGYTFNEFKTKFLPNINREIDSSEKALAREEFLDALKRTSRLIPREE